MEPHYIYMDSLTEDEKERFVHYATRYGSIIMGGNSTERAEFLKNTLEGPFVTIDCTQINSKDDFVRAILNQTGYNVTENEIIGFGDASRSLQNNEYSILILEFEKLSDEIRTYVAQCLKGLGGSSRYTGMIGYACTQRESVVRAESDMSMRIRPWSLD